MTTASSRLLGFLLLAAAACAHEVIIGTSLLDLLPDTTGLMVFGQYPSFPSTAVVQDLPMTLMPSLVVVRIVGECTGLSVSDAHHASVTAGQTMVVLNAHACRGLSLIHI